MDRTESKCSKFNDKIMQTAGIDLEQTATEIIIPPHPVIRRRPLPTPRNKSIKTWQSYRQFRLPTARRSDEWKPLSSRMRGNFEMIYSDHRFHCFSHNRWHLSDWKNVTAKEIKKKKSRRSHDKAVDEIKLPPTKHIVRAMLFRHNFRPCSWILKLFAIHNINSAASRSLNFTLAWSYRLTPRKL